MAEFCAKSQDYTSLLDYVSFFTWIKQLLAISIRLAWFAVIILYEVCLNTAGLINNDLASNERERPDEMDGISSQKLIKCSVCNIQLASHNGVSKSVLVTCNFEPVPCKTKLCNFEPLLAQDYRTWGPIVSVITYYIVRLLGKV